MKLACWKDRVVGQRCLPTIWVAEVASTAVLCSVLISGNDTLTTLHVLLLIWTQSPYGSSFWSQLNCLFMHLHSVLTVYLILQLLSQKQQQQISSFHSGRSVQTRQDPSGF